MSGRRDRENTVSAQRGPISPDRIDRAGAGGGIWSGVTEGRDALFQPLRDLPRREVHNPKLGSKKDTADSITEVVLVDEGRRRDQVLRRPNRSREPEQAPSLHLRPQEKALLVDVGRFRVISVADLEQSLYPGQTRQLQNDLAYLRDQGLVETHLLNLRRDGKSHRIEQFQAVVLTKAGRTLTQRIAELPVDQQLYHGMVKRREAEHDSQIYRAYRKELPGLEAQGGRNIRIRLDFELKAEFNRRVYRESKQQSDADPLTVKQQVATEMQLPLNEGRVIVPDARIEYDLPNGATGRVEIEVVTAAYRHGHVAAKAQAGFKLYMSQGDIGRLGGAIADDHDLMSGVLDL